MVKIVVKVENGLVQDVYSNSENVEVLVLDKDNNGADEDEVITDEEIFSFCKNENLKPISYASGIIDEREEGNPVLDYYNDIKTKPQLF
jgi:hypothetical protein